MQTSLKSTFLELWGRFFGSSELPIVFYYSDTPGEIPLASRGQGHRCVIEELARVRAGESLAFDTEHVGCMGGKRYMGFSDALRPTFRWFLSCGIPGQVEGERYKQSPELVDEVLSNARKFQAPAKYLVFKRWDTIEEVDAPDVAIFFATPDVLSGLFTLANYDRAALPGVITPFGAGCATIVQYPYQQQEAEHPQCVLGMFDVSARPYVPSNVLTFAMPVKRLEQLVGFMEESFLITPSWEKVRDRL